MADIMDVDVAVTKPDFLCPMPGHCVWADQLQRPVLAGECVALLPSNAEEERLVRCKILEVRRFGLIPKAERKSASPTAADHHIDPERLYVRVMHFYGVGEGTNTIESPTYNDDMFPYATGNFELMTSNHYQWLDPVFFTSSIVVLTANDIHTNLAGATRGMSNVYSLHSHYVNNNTPPSILPLSEVCGPHDWACFPEDHLDLKGVVGSSDSKESFDMQMSLRHTVQQMLFNTRHGATCDNRVMIGVSMRTWPDWVSKLQATTTMIKPIFRTKKDGELASVVTPDRTIRSQGFGCTYHYLRFKTPAELACLAMLLGGDGMAGPRGYHGIFGRRAEEPLTHGAPVNVVRPLLKPGTSVDTDESLPAKAYVAVVRLTYIASRLYPRLRVSLRWSVADYPEGFESSSDDDDTGNDDK